MTGQKLTIRTRTRVLREPQSHNGCFTCKRRRVRCDLMRPVCKRCAKAGKVCEGYRAQSQDTDDTGTPEKDISLVQLPWRPVMRSVTPTGQFEHIRLTKLGCEIFHNAASLQRGMGNAIWSTLPILGQTDHLVAASMAAFGASFETMSNPNNRNMTVYARYYANALRLVQEALSDPKTSSLILMLGCLLLSSSEVVIGQEWPALYHLQGTLQVLKQRQSLMIESAVEDQGSEGDSQFTVQDDLDAAGALIDLGVSTYALGRNPRLPRLTNARPGSRTSHSDESSLDEFRIVQTLHSSYIFSNVHFNWRYVPNHLMPAEVFVNQNKICTELFQRIQEIAQFMSAKDSSNLRQAYILRAQCSVCLVYLQNLFEPRETSYDRFLASFNSIVEDAEEALQGVPEQSRVNFQFSLDLGVVHPLYFTAIKCRDLQTRLKATSLLHKTGREGAWDGQRVAVVARRAIQLEVGTPDVYGRYLETKQNIHVPESKRLHGANSAAAESLDAMATEVHGFFSRCNDVEKMMQATTAEDYKDDRHWENWQEYIPYNPNGEPRPA